MSHAYVTGSRRSPAVLATVRRIQDALAAPSSTDPPAVGAAEPPVPVATPSRAPSAARFIVDPAAWFAEQTLTPSAATLHTSVGYSLAPYGSATLQDDVVIARMLAAVCHPELRVVEHLRRLGCRAVHVPLGARSDPRPAVPSGDRLVTFGLPTARRKLILAAAAPMFEELPCAHLFQSEPPFPVDDLPAVLAQGHVFVDVAPYDAAAPHPAVLLAALEAGAAIVTEALGPLPPGIDDTVIRAPHETVCARGVDQARDPEDAAARARAGLAAWGEVSPLAAMGAALREVMAAAERPPPLGAAAHRPTLSHHAEPATPVPTVVQQLRAERAHPDAGLRDGVQRVLRTLREFDARVTDLEQGGPAPDTADVVRRGAPPADCRVSVLIPCFAACATLEAALDSVQRAAAALDTNRTVEVMLVDDASPSGDGALAAAWADAHPELPVTVLRHVRNRGLARTRNTALAHACGEYVLPLDADNLLRPQGLRRLLDALVARPDAAFAYGILQEFDTSGPIGLRGLYPWSPARLAHGNYVDALALVRRHVLTRHGGYTADMPEQGYEDWDLWCRCAEADDVGVWVPEMVASYRVRADSMSADLHLSHVASLADMVQRHPELLK